MGENKQGGKGPRKVLISLQKLPWNRTLNQSPRWGIGLSTEMEYHLGYRHAQELLCSSAYACINFGVGD
jgi:hypothetical protein